jgi:hypothetical protein
MPYACELLKGVRPWPPHRGWFTWPHLPAQIRNEADGAPSHPANGEDPPANCAIPDTELAGAGGRSRTDTLSPEPDFESGASTNSATPASLPAPWSKPAPAPRRRLTYMSNRWDERAFHHRRDVSTHPASKATRPLLLRVRIGSGRNCRTLRSLIDYHALGIAAVRPPC